MLCPPTVPFCQGSPTALCALKLLEEPCGGGLPSPKWSRRAEGFLGVTWKQHGSPEPSVQIEETG